MTSRKDAERSTSSTSRKAIDLWLAASHNSRNLPRVWELWTRKTQMVATQWLKIARKIIAFRTLFILHIRTSSILGLNDITQTMKMSLLMTSMMMMIFICRKIISKMHQSNKVRLSQKSKRLRRRSCSTTIWDHRQQIWKRRRSISIIGTTKKLRPKSLNPRKCRRRTNWSSSWNSPWKRSSRRVGLPKSMAPWTSATFLWDLLALIWLCRILSNKTSHSTMLSTTWLRIAFS